MDSYSSTIELRLKSLGVFILVIVGVLLWRMVDIQILQHVKYQKMATGQQRFEKSQMAERGKILVHDSPVDKSQYYPLAFDIKKFAVWIVPRNVKDKDKLAGILEPLLQISKKDIFDKINNNKQYIPPMKRGLDLDQAGKIDELGLAGVLVLPEYSRYYPESMLASQVLGFVNADGEGNYGFEGKYNEELKGKNGDIKGEKDTLGRVISLLEQTDPKNGNSYVLTIDRAVQYFVEKKLSEALTLYQASSGTIAIMDVETGGILAMASAPSYDPNDYRTQADKDPTLFINPAISSLYEPGSIFKPIIMSGAIEQGVVAPETEEVFDWHTWVDGYEIKTAERKPFGRENMTQVLQNSDNVAMVWISEKMGKESVYKYLKAYNFLDKTGIRLSGEATGYTSPLKQWKDINRATISFGQGIAVTPLQILCAYAALANGGVYEYPQIVDKIIYSDGTEIKNEKVEGERITSKDTADKVNEMLRQVVENGHSKKAKVAGFKVGAKTGTAQIPKLDGGYEESEDGLGIYTHSLAGLAPTDNPKFAMLVKLDRPKSAKYAESTAAPLFGEIASFLLNYHYRLTPTEPLD
ncbi:MAG: penicillin-binding protein 2 [Patescibacteria group bacterium]